MNAPVTMHVTGAVLCLIELGVGSTLLISLRWSWKHIVQRGFVLPWTNECLVILASGNHTLWERIRSRYLNTAGSRARTFCFFLLQLGGTVERFFSFSLVDQTSLLSLIRPLLVVSMQCTFLCPKCIGCWLFLPTNRSAIKCFQCFVHRWTNHS